MIPSTVRTLLAAVRIYTANLATPASSAFGLAQTAVKRKTSKPNKDQTNRKTAASPSYTHRRKEIGERERRLTFFLLQATQAEAARSRGGLSPAIALEVAGVCEASLSPIQPRAKKKKKKGEKEEEEEEKETIRRRCVMKKKK